MALVVSFNYERCESMTKKFSTKGRVLTGALLTVNLSFGVSGVATADSSLLSQDNNVTVDDLLEKNGDSVQLSQVEDDSVLNEIDELLGDAQLPDIVDELVGTPVDVNELSAVIDKVDVYAGDGEIIDAETLPTIDDGGVVALPSDDGDDVFALSPADVESSSSLGAARVSEVEDVDVTVISQVTENMDAQLIAVVDDEEVDYVDFSVEIPEGSTLTPFYGGFILQNAQGGLEGWIEPAWAVDAEGEMLPTSYELTEDGTIRQNIDTSNATFPIVADPKATKSSKSCGVIVGVTGVLHAGLWGYAVGGPVGSAVGVAYGLFWVGVASLC